MQIKLIIIAITAFILFSCESAKKPVILNMNSDSSNLQQSELLKEHAFCQCLHYGFKNKEVLNNDISLSFYKESLLYSNLVQSKIDSVAESFANSILPSSHMDYLGKRATCFSCMEFLKSNDLDSIVKSSDADIIN